MCIASTGACRGHRDAPNGNQLVRSIGKVCVSEQRTRLIDNAQGRQGPDSVPNSKNYARAPSWRTAPQQRVGDSVPAPTVCLPANGMDIGRVALQSAQFTRGIHAQGRGRGETNRARNQQKGAALPA